MSDLIEHSSGNAPAPVLPSLGYLALASCMLALVGFLVPATDYDASLVPVVLTICVLGGLFLRITGGRSLGGLLIDSYSKGVIAATIVLFVGMWWAAQYGDFPPHYMIDRFKSTVDDNRVFEHFILPAVGDSSVSLLDGETNAPLYWWGHVELQNLFVDTSGRVFPMGANLLNICVGGMTIALMGGACHLALSRRRPDVSRRMELWIRYCPWLLAASVLAIREIWVHCLFAASLFFGFRARELRGARRMLLLSAGVVLVSAAAFMLRPDMIPILAPLPLICAWVPRADRAVNIGLSRRRLVAILMGVLVVLIGLASIETIRDAVVGAIEKRAIAYIEFGDKAQVDQGSQDTLVHIFGDNILLRGTLLSAWLWEQPLPKFSIKPGSIYALGRQLVPLWLLSMVYVCVPIFRRHTAAARAWWKRNWPLVLELLISTLLVGFTSGEVRHVFNLLPVVCVLIAGVVAIEEPEFAIWPPMRRFLGMTVLICIAITLLMFGPDSLFLSN